MGVNGTKMSQNDLISCSNAFSATKRGVVDFGRSILEYVELEHTRLQHASEASNFLKVHGSLISRNQSSNFIVPEILAEFFSR